MTVYPPQLLQELDSHHVFLDTGAFIYAAKNQSFFELVTSLKDKAHCGLATIPSVLFEFTRSPQTLEEYNERVAFVKTIIDRIDPMHFLEKIPDFYAVMAKLNGGNKAYTDFLLAACLYNYRHSKTALLTTDLQAYPDFFPRTHIIAVEQKSEIRNFGVYQFDPTGYAVAASKVLEEMAVPKSV